MEIKDLITLGITSGLVAGIIASITDFFIQLLSKTADAKMESKKYLNSLNDYRYKKLTENLDELLKLATDFETKTFNVVEKEGGLPIDLYFEYNKKLDKFYKKTNPILDKKYRENLKISFDTIIDAHKAYLEDVITDSIEDNNSGAEYVINVQRYENALIESIQNQLIELILK